MLHVTSAAVHLVLACDEVASFCLLFEAHCETTGPCCSMVENNGLTKEHDMTFSISTMLPLIRFTNGHIMQRGTTEMTEE